MKPPFLRKMILIDINGLTVSFGENEIFSSVDLQVQKGQCIGLTGLNGAGKTTLMRAIVGLQEYSAGTISIAKGLRIGYLQQQHTANGIHSVLEEATKSFDPLFAAEERMHRIEAEMANEDADMVALGEKYQAAQMEFEARGGYGWRSGYHWVFLLQAGMTAILFLSLPVWKRVAPERREPEAAKEKFSLWRIACLPGVPASLIAFFCYCALETTTGLWATSFLVSKTGLTAEDAATCTSLFFLGITLGRFLSGFVADRVGDRGMVRAGVCLMGLGTLLLLAFPEHPILAVAALLVTGIGGAPYYPALIHSTPVLFGEAHASAVMGLQMASAYVGSALAPPLFGLLAEGFSLSLLPLYLVILVLGMAILTEKGWRQSKHI